jgi:2-polyprenyl-6-methoxyphenol hydroxylase-like FAD-dependent oxidoreductase
MDGLFGGHSVRVADLSRLNVKYPFIAFMPQWDFLNFLRESGRRFGSLKVMMNTEAIDLIWRGEAIAGVKARTPEGVIDIEAIVERTSFEDCFEGLWLEGDAVPF